MTFLCDLGLILKGEIRCLSLLGFKGQGHENKGNDRLPKKLCFLNKFSLSVPKGM